MVTEDMIRIIRENVRRARDKEREEWIEGRIGWSRIASKKNWVSRFFIGAPNHVFTREEAINSINSDLGPALETRVRWVGQSAIKICDAIQTANANNLPLRLTVAEVAELRKWL